MMGKPTRTEYQRGRILKALAEQPMTAQQLAEKLHMTRSSILQYLRTMKAETPRLIHVCGHLANFAARPAEVHALGDKPDAKYVPKKTPTRHLIVKQRRADIMRRIRAKPMTKAQLAESLGLKLSGVEPHITAMKKEKLLHVAHWVTNPTGYPAPAYGAGGKPDAPRPAPLSTSEKNARHWAKLKANPRRYAVYRQIQRAKARPQSWFGALTLRPMSAPLEYAELEYAE